MKRRLPFLTAALTALTLTACVGSMPVRGDSSKSLAGGSAAGANAQGENATLEKCNRPMGTIAVVEDQNSEWYHYFTQEYRLHSTVPILRLLIQQSNCFIVVDRGRAMRNMGQERDLQRSGELRAGSNFGKGQMVSADYSLTPEVIMSARDTGGLGAALGAFGGKAAIAGALLGAIKTNEASTMLTLVDNRSGVQVGVSEGSSSNTDFSLGGLLGGSRVGAGLGGYTNTPQGKVIAGAFMEAYNELVRAVRNYTAQTMGDRDLGTGGRLSVDGATQKHGIKNAANRKISIRQAQQILSDLGYDVKVNGKLDNTTRQAITDFQNDRGIETTGRLDASTKAELLSQQGN